MTELLKAAENDYKIILRLWNDIGDEWGMQGAMYHFQQAIEKLLKTLIMISGNEFPHTHDINRLLKLYPDADELPSELNELAGVLTSWEAETRYGSSLLTNIKTLEECKSIYNGLHELVLSKMTEESDCSYTLEVLFKDPPTLIAVIREHETDYVEWFKREFPNGASSKDEVLSRLQSEK